MLCYALIPEPSIAGPSRIALISCLGLRPDPAFLALGLARRAKRPFVATRLRRSDEAAPAAAPHPRYDRDEARSVAPPPRSVPRSPVKEPQRSRSFPPPATKPRGRKQGCPPPQQQQSLALATLRPAADRPSAPRLEAGRNQVDRAGLERNARLLESVLEDFHVRGDIVEVRPGPVVTMYELEPASGIKASRVIQLADDIARNMSALCARVADHSRAAA
jgi:S-DNA-T family DNA segregation ATPase FtsK/SpoIIIE